MSTITARPAAPRARLSRMAASVGRKRRFVLDAAVLLVVVVVLVFFLPARAVVAGLGAAGRPHFIVAVALLVWWLVSLVHPRLRASGSHALTTLVFVYVGWLAVTWAAGYDRGLTPAESSGTDRSMIAAFAYLGIVAVAAAGLTTRRRVDLVLRTVVVGAAFSAVFGWIQFFMARDYTAYLMPPGLVANQPLVGISERGSEQFARVAGTAGHYIEFGVVCAMTLPLAIHYAMQRPRGKRGAAWLAVVLIGGAVPFSLSRSAIIAFALVALVMLVGWPGRWRLNAICTLVLAIPVYMVIKPGLLGTIKSLFLNAATDPSITGRTSDYATVWRYVLERPFVGRGTGTFIPDQYILLDNQWLLSLIEIGWVGVVLLAVLFLSTIRVLLTLRRRANFLGDAATADLALSLTALVATFAVTAAFFDAFFFTTATTLLWLTIGVTVALARQQRRQLERLGIRPLGAGQRLRELVTLARGKAPTVPVDVETARWI